MATIPKMIKAALDFSKTLPEQLLAQGHAVLTGLTGNDKFLHLPVNLDDLKATLDAYSASIVEAKDGGKKAIASRNQNGEILIRMLRAIATYVELNCKDDINIFLTSGLRPRSTVRNSVQELDKPKLDGIEQGISGELIPWIRKVRGAKHYQVRFGVVGPDGSAPSAWQTKLFPTARGASIGGLTPGTTYAFQVCAYGPLGYTDWSDYATRMCI